MKPDDVSTKLFLDDVRKPPDSTWAVVRNHGAFVRYIEENGVPEVISFDHDLADEHYQALDAESYAAVGGTFREKTGCECARFLIQRGEFPKLAIIHTLNPVGAEHLIKLLSPHCEVRRQPRSMP